MENSMGGLQCHCSVKRGHSVNRSTDDLDDKSMLILAYFRERPGLFILMLSQDATHTGLLTTPNCTVGETQLDIFSLRFLVDGSCKVKEGEEVEEDEKGEKANVLIVKEDEEVEEEGAEEKEIIEEAAKEDVATIQDTLDTLPLENKQENVENLPEETKTSEILKEETSKEEKVEEKVEQKAEEEVEKKAEEKVEKKVEMKVELKETRS